MGEPPRTAPGAPPGLARRLLARVVPDAERPTVLGELDEMYRDRVGARGAAHARRWYWRQVMGFVVRGRGVRRAAAAGTREGTMAWFGDFLADVRHAVRGLRARPAFTAVALATLALGIGANSAVLTLANAHFLAELPYHRPDDLVLIWETGRDSDEVTTVSPGNYLTWRDEAASFADIAAFNVDYATLSGDGVAERVSAAAVAPHFFDVVGVAPVLGSGFDDGEIRGGDGDVVLLSHGLWTRRYGADPAIVGTSIRVDGRPHRVAGVLPADYRQPERGLAWQGAEVWRPLVLDGQRERYGARFLRTVARLTPGVVMEQARAEMAGIAVRMEAAHPEANRGRRIQVWTLDDYLLGSARPVLWLLLAAGAAVLLIVCANVANLTLARGQERRREFAVRAALGSGRGRLVRQVLAESVVLAWAGGALGALVAYAGRDVLQAVQSRFFSGLVAAEVDLAVVVGTTALALAAGLLFGLPSALSASATDLRGALGEGGARAGRRTHAARNLLVVGQVALATSLLVVSLLLTRSFAAMVGVPPGFESEGVLTFSVAPPRSGYDGREALVQYFRDLGRELESVPGVTAVSMVSDLPFTTENRWTSVEVEGVPWDPEAPPTTEQKIVLPGYFGVMGIPLLSGSLPGDGWAATDGDVPVAVNQELAARFWPDRDPLGRTLTLHWDSVRVLRVAAVVGNVLDDGFDAAPDPLVYIPWGAMPQGRMSFVLRTAGTVPGLAEAVQGAVGRVDADVPAADLRALDALMAETVVRPRAASLLGATFALLALLVAAAGIYGVVSYLVQSRTREIGIRAALGASADQLMRLVLGHSTRLVVVGLLLGVGGALLAGRVLAGVLFGIRPWDPPSMVGAAAVLAAVATAAALIPARRALRVDPREALRAE